MLLENTIKSVFGAVLDWTTEQLTFRTAEVKLKAFHRKATAQPENPDTAQCSLVTVDPRVEPVPVFLTNKCSIPHRSEKALQVASENAPTETSAAIIEALISTFDETESFAVPEAFQDMVVAHTACHWSSANKTAVFQMGNPSDQYMYLKRDTLLGRVTPVSLPPIHTISASQTDSKPTKSTRSELRTALTKAFDKTTFTPGE